MEDVLPHPELFPRAESTKGEFVDMMLVFGQGPVKPVLFESELTQDQKEAWRDFTRDPLQKTEPDFRVVNSREFDDIRARTDLTDTEKEELIRLKRDKLQHTGRLALNRWGRQNALAAGALLVAGDTTEVLLSGGPTIPAWAKESLPQHMLDNWPSEAELMKDIIISRFADAYQKKFGRSIETVISTEARSTNTLENLAHSLNTDVSLTKPDARIGLLATDFHIQRSALITQMFSIESNTDDQHGAQSVLGARATKLPKNSYAKHAYDRILSHLNDVNTNVDLQSRIQNEDRWTSGLVEPAHLAYWLGYFGMVNDPKVIQRALESLSDPKWQEQARSEFAKVGLDFDAFSGQDLQRLEAEHPAEFLGLQTKLIEHKQEHRTMPPPPNQDQKTG